MDAPSLQYEIPGTTPQSREQARLSAGSARLLNQGDLVSEWYLADAYRKGQGVRQRYIEAGRWYLKIAGSCTRHMGWTPFVALFVMAGVLGVPERRWRRAQ